MTSPSRILCVVCLLLLTVTPAHPPPVEPVVRVDPVTVIPAGELHDELYAYAAATTTTTTTTLPPPPPVARDEGTRGAQAPQEVASYDAGAIGELICSVFVEDCGRALRVADCESHFNPYARNSSGAAGLFQLLGHGDLYAAHGWDAAVDWSDPYRNTVVAHDLWLESGWRPWTCA